MNKNNIKDSFQHKLNLLVDLYRPSIDKEALLRACFIKDEQEILDNLTHLQLVTYAYKCSSSVVKFIKDKKVLQKTNKCLDLVNQWIGSHYNNKNNNNKKPSNDALTKATHDAARSAANAAAYYAAYSAYSAADTARSAAYAAADAADADSDYDKARHKQEQLNFKYLIETLNNPQNSSQIRHSPTPRYFKYSKLLRKIP